MGQAVVRLVDEIITQKAKMQSHDSKGKEKDWQIYLTGHSMGGALATLCAYELAVDCLSSPPIDLSVLSVMPLTEGWWKRKKETG